MRLILLLLIPLFSLSQSQEKIDSLKKYTYFIYGKYGVNNAIVGSGCFVKSNGKTFVVSNKHVLTAWDGKKNMKKDSFPDTMWVKIPLPEANNFYELPINSKAISDTITGNTFFKDPDVFVWEVFIPKKVHINTLENFIERSVNQSQLDNLVYSWSYPYYFTSHIPTTNIPPPPCELSISTFHTQLAERVRVYGTNEYDTIYYTLKKKFGKAGHGSSGSPVFFLSYDTRRWIFAGLISGTGISDDFIVVIKPSFVIDAIQHRLVK
jgi:hypothetical protein